ncbi:S41 family peptidase [Porphyromonadaceae bacterium OttesenSCG-928-L07]|nr:S41 family peptidase [Porphyromonadaceae bacterium OttesenSCG-928-L07]MDL2252332.1 S41 family peptidase [Odoribacter sp. OttesenSCG-928-J03]
MKAKKFLIISLAVILAGLGALSFNSDDKNFEISKQLSIYAALFREINLFYVDEVDPGDLVNTGIKSMLKSLDPYTIYYPESHMEDVKLMTTGEYAGIGALISKKGDEIVIRESYKNSPATKAGIFPGDIITAIDGNSVQGKSTDDVSELLKGQPGKELTVKAIREGNPMEFKIIREKIQMPSVPYYGMVNDKVGYISFSSFIQKSGNDVRRALLDLKNKGAESLILDLRGNGGGLLDQAVEISNLFLPKGSSIVSTRGKLRQLDKEYTTLNNPIAADMPLVLLIDRESASASEIVSGALQDYDRAVLIGERSLGKGLVQTVKDLPYNTKMKVTTAKYYIPSGRSIQEIDYSHRNAEGYAEKIPDSLKKEFTTKAGRKVYDGGGITPDIAIQQGELSKITKELIIKDLFFDFANSYALKVDSIPAPAGFVITDEIYEQFKAFIKNRDFSYETESQKVLEKLIKTAKNEKYYDSTQQALEQLKKELTHSIDRDTDLFKEEISRFLAEYMMQRYYYSEGVIEYNTHKDEEIAKAVEVLSDKETYLNLLKN